jgi:hypothetical protein
MEDTAHFSAKEAEAEAEADGSTVAGSLVGWCPCLSKSARIAGECSAEGARVEWLWCGLLATRMCVCVYMEYRFYIRRCKSRRLPRPRSWRLWSAVSAEIGWPATDLG